MVPLNLMTGATAETRLVLLAWMSQFGMKPIPDDRLRIASILRVTNKHLKVAIDYLVEEGFLLKRRNSLRVVPGGKKVAKFSYTLRIQSWEAWDKALQRMHLKDIFKDVVDGNVHGKSLALRQPKPLEASERLVLALMITHCNSAFYVVDFDHSSNSKLLGVSFSDLNKIIRRLVSNGYLTAYSHTSTSKAELRSLGTIYRVDALTRKRKKINIGLPPIESVESIALLAKLESYYHKAEKRHNPDIYPPQSSFLDDKSYFKLSDIFHANRLFPFMHHLCQSIIFSTVSDCLARLIDLNKADRDDAIKLLKDELTDVIEIKLSEVVLKGKPESKKLISMELTERKPESENELEILTRYTIMQLSQELTYSVITLVRQLILFQEIYHIPFSVISHEPHTIMMVLTAPAENPATEVKHETDTTFPAVHTLLTREHAKLRLRTDFVLTCSVPNFEYLNDCLIIKNELFIESSRFNDPRIQIVDEVKLYQINYAKRPRKKGRKSKKVASVIENAGR